VIARRDAILDALGTLAAAGVGIALWSADRQQSTTLLPADSPWWARLKDHLLDGPDAGAWASNALALAAGNRSDLDPHRLPVLPYLTAFVLKFQPDPALAGHLVNHVLHVLLGPVIYLLASRWMGRGMALGAAIAAVTYPLGVAAADRYGVDPLVALALPLAMLAAEGGARFPAWSVVFGVLVGVASTCHLTTVGAWAPALLLCLLRGQPGWRRWVGTLGLAAGGLLGVGLVFLDYPTLPFDLFIGSLAEGVAPTGPTGGDVPAQSVLEKAVAIVVAGGPSAVEDVVALLLSTARPRWLPWSLALALPWLGVLGVAVEREQGRSSRASRFVGGLRAGLPLAAALVPLLAFAAAGSPPRYSANFVPLGIVLMFRGLATAPALLDRALERFERWPAGVLGLVLGLASAGSLWNEDLALGPSRRPPNGRDIGDWRLGALLRAHFPPGGGAASLRREAIAYAGRVYCPFSPGYNFRMEKEPYRAHLSTECGGEGPIPYVVLAGDGTGASAERVAMDAWVTQHAPLVAEYSDAFVEARIYAVDRVQAD
jgi:hypothetical protein